MTHRVVICTTCVTGAGLARLLQLALQELTYAVGETVCMSGCTRPSTISFRATGKTAYLFGDLTEADLPELVAFARLYLDAPDGNFADARPIGDLRSKAIARIPG